MAFSGAGAYRQLTWAGEMAVNTTPFELDNSTRQYLLSGESPESAERISEQLDYERDLEQRRRVACSAILAQTQAIASEFPRYLHLAGERPVLSAADHKLLGRLWFKRDARQSQHHYHLAGPGPTDAEALVADAQCALNGCPGIARAPALALDKLRQAAQAGHVGAMQQLSRVLETGQDGIAVDRGVALIWTLRRQALNEQELGSAYFIGRRQLREQRQRLELRMSVDERERATVLAKQYAENHPLPALPPACRALAPDDAVE